MPNINKAIKLSTIDEVEDPKATPKTRKEEEKSAERNKIGGTYRSSIETNEYNPIYRNMLHIINAMPTTTVHHVNRTTN